MESQNIQQALDGLTHIVKQDAACLNPEARLALAAFYLDRGTHHTHDSGADLLRFAVLAAPVAADSPHALPAELEAPLGVCAERIASADAVIRAVAHFADTETGASLEEAIIAAQLLICAWPRNHFWASAQAILAELLYARYELHNNEADLARAIIHSGVALHQASNLMAPHATLLRVANVDWKARLTRFEKANDPDDLLHATESMAVSLREQQDPRVSVRLADTFYQLYMLTDEESYTSNAMRELDKLDDLEDHQDDLLFQAATLRCQCLATTVGLHRRESDVQAFLAAMSEAAKYLGGANEEKVVLRLSQEVESGLTKALEGSSRITDVVKTGTLSGATPEKLINTYYKLLAEYPPDSDFAFYTHYNLAYTFLYRFDEEQDLKDLLATIDHLSEIAKTRSVYDEDSDQLVRRLPESLVGYLVETGDTESITRVLHELQQAIARLGDATPFHSSYQHALGMVYLTRSYTPQLRHEGDRERALDLIARAAESCRLLGASDRAAALAAAGSLFLTQHIEQQGERWISDATRMLRGSLRLTGAGDPMLPNRLLNLGNALLLRHEWSESTQDLAEALELMQRSLKLTPTDNTSSVASATSSLGLVYFRRFECEGHVDDLFRAAELHSKALSLTPEEGAVRSAMLANLGSVLNTADRWGLDITIDGPTNVDLLTEALAKASTTDARKVEATLGNAFLARFRLNRSLSDLDQAVVHLEHAAQGDPEGKDPRTLISLAHALITRGEATSDAASLDAAVERLNQVAGRLKGRSALRAQVLFSLSRGLGSLADLSDPLARISITNRRVVALREVVACTETNAWVRIRASAALGSILCRDFESPSEGLYEFRRAMRQIPTVFWQAHDSLSIMLRTREVGDIASNAAACAILAKEPELAVEWLEFGRLLMWESVSPGNLAILARLKNEHPEDYAGLMRQERMRYPGRLAAKYDGGAVQTRDEIIFDEMDQSLVERIRSLGDGYEQLFQSWSWSELNEAATDGPIAIINASDLGCHCVMVGVGARAKVIELPMVTYSEVRRHAGAFMLAMLSESEGGRRGSPDALVEAHNTMEWLWDAICVPLLEGLPERSEPQRLWLMPTGALTGLPIHAAGYYPRIDYPLSDDARRSDRRQMIRRAVSSYCLSIKGISPAAAEDLTGEPAFMFAGISEELEWAGLGPLPNVSVEMASLQSALPSGPRHTYLTDTEATKASVVASMRSSSMVHFACHGVLDSGDPRMSGLALHDGVLRVEDLVGRDVGGGFLCFLSVCQGALSDPEWPDEQLNLVGAMRAAGFRHVIGTLWDESDPIAAMIGAAFYKDLVHEDGLRDPAYCLRSATLAILDDPFIARDPGLWAGFIHVGS